MKVYGIWIKTTLPAPHTAEWGRHSTGDCCSQEHRAPYSPFPRERAFFLEVSRTSVFLIKSPLPVSEDKSQASAVKSWGLPSLPQLLLWYWGSTVECHPERTLTLSPTPAPERALAQTILLMGEDVIKHIVPNLFPQNLTSFAKQLGKF